MYKKSDIAVIDFSFFDNKTIHTFIYISLHTFSYSEFMQKYELVNTASIAEK